MTFIHRALFFVAVVWLSACGKPDHDEFDALILEQEAREAEVIERGKRAVLLMLKDPASAQFRNVSFNHGMSVNVAVACGEVNSRNGFGGYGGFTRFVSAGTRSLTYVDEQVDGFAEIWSRYCS